MSQNAAETKKTIVGEVIDKGAEPKKKETTKPKSTTKLTESLAGLSNKKADPFKEAEQAESKNPDATKADFKDVKPEPVKLKQKINPKAVKPKTQAKSSFVGILGLVAALFAIGWSYYQDRVFDNYKKSIVNELDSRDSNIAGLTTRMDELKVNSAQVTRTVEINSKALGKVDMLSQQVSRANENINDLRAEITQLQKRIESNSTAIKENNETTEEIRNYMDMLSKRSTRPKTSPNKQTTKKNYNLGHAVLASIDKWGNEVNAVLKNESGWIPLRMGDLYQGWKLVGAQNDEAIFKKGKKELRLSIQE